MRHKTHGNKVATSEDEAKADEARGWERYDVEKAPAPRKITGADLKKPSEPAAA
jgi:hypothetical protein